MKVKVAATQMSISWDIENNIAKATKMVEDAVKEGANIVLLQELFKTPYFSFKVGIYFFIFYMRNICI